MEKALNQLLTASAAGVLSLVAISTASAQTVVVQDPYTPVYAAPAPLYDEPVLVSPARRVYVAPAPVYVQPPSLIGRREVVITEPSPWDEGPVYAEW